MRRVPPLFVMSLAERLAMTSSPQSKPAGTIADLLRRRLREIGRSPHELAEAVLGLPDVVGVLRDALGGVQGRGRRDAGEQRDGLREGCDDCGDSGPPSPMRMVLRIGLLPPAAFIAWSNAAAK